MIVITVEWIYDFWCVQLKKNNVHYTLGLYNTSKEATKQADKIYNFLNCVGCPTIIQENKINE